MIDPGRLNKRLTLQAPVESDDGQGGVVRDYVGQQTLWAQVEPLAARDGVAANTGGAVLRVRITLRGGVALSRDHRLAYGASVYRIIAWRERDDGRLIEIDAELQQA
jgi:SPP1 family predicted phage head-tail adaptor